MNTYLAEMIATERIAELRREADARRRAADVPRQSRSAEVVRWLRGHRSLPPAALIEWLRTA